MSYLSDFEHTKLDAQVFPGRVVQKHYISSAISGRRRVPITKVWKVEKLLGKGTFGEVRLEACSPERTNTNEKREERAVKRIWTTGTEFKRSYERELKALLEFSKPKYKESAVFVEFLGWFEDLESVYLAMEYLPLGDLEDNVLAVGGSIKEEGVREIAVQVLEGLRIMHLENFAHRDLKPKNVLVCQGPPNWWVKLADFGLSKRRTDETGFRTQTGTFAYMAPELLNYIPDIDPETSEYTNAVDMWALGCIVYRLVCGIVPFPPGPSLVKFCVDGSAFPPKLEELTGLGQSFVKGLIVPYPSRRLTAQQALDHPWTQSGLETLNFESQSISFGGYDTATHPGLQSHEPATTTLIVDSGAAARGMPRTYHPPTVEDEKEETGSDTGSESDEIEEPESMMRPSPTKLKSSKKNQGGPSDREEPNKRSPQAPSDPYIVEPPAPSPAQPKKPSLQSYTSRSQSPSPPPRKAPTRSRTQGLDPYIVEPPLPRPSVMTKPSLQGDSSGKPPLVTRKEPTRSKTQDYPRSKVIPPLPRAQTFRPVDQVPPMRRAETYTSARTPPLPRAATFQAADRRPSRLREDYSSVGSDSDDSWFYEKPALSHNPAPGRSEKSRQDSEWSESEESGGGVSNYSQHDSDPGELSDASNFGVSSESSHQLDPMPIYAPAQAYTNARNEFSKGVPLTQEMLNILNKAKRGTSSTHVRENAPIEAPAYAPATRTATRRGIEKVGEWIKYVKSGITPPEGMGIPFEQPDPSPSSGQASGSLVMDKNRPAYYADEKGFIEVASRPSPRHHTRHTSTGDGLRLPRAHTRHVSTGDVYGVPPNAFSPRYNSSGLYATANGARAPEYVHIDPVLHREETRPIPSASALRARVRAEGYYLAKEDLVYRYYAQRDKADKWLRNNPQAIGTEQEKYHIRKRDEAHQWLSDWWRPERRPWGNEYGEKEVRNEGTVSYKDGVSDGYDSGW